MKVLFCGLRKESLIVLQRFVKSNYNKELDVFTFKNTKVYETLNDIPYNNLYLGVYSKKECLRRLDQILSDTDYDVLLSVGFPFIISKQLFNKYTKCTFLNLHPHILPKWKGSNVIKESVEDNEILFGATLHRMTSKVDEGEIIHQEKIEIKNKDLGFIYETVFGLIEPYVLLKGLTKECIK